MVATRASLFMVLLLCLSACAGGGRPSESAPTSPDVEAPERNWPPALDEVALRRAGPALAPPRLDIAVEVFDTGLGDLAGLEVESTFAEVRKAESLYLPVQLRRVLEESGYWGVVRVVPVAPESVPVQVSGRIEHADGRDLVISVSAVDASGATLLNRRYRGRATAEDYPVGAGDPPFAAVYHQVANDLAAIREGWDAAQSERLQQLATLRFAARLAPGAFADYVREDGEGGLQLARVPSAGDPMLQRILRLQRQEHLFIDTVDEQYRTLVSDFAPTYHLWQEYSRELVVYEEQYRERAAEREIQGRRGTFSAMQSTYNLFRRAKIHEQDLYELAQGFDNEVTGTVVDVDDRVFRLQGSLQEQFSEWRRILSEILALETEPAL
jgi:hypothetical protein